MIHSSTADGVACHRKSGPAGLYGAETSGCDSPLSLVNATFQWIDEHLKESIDFVIWTGDSARHDNDEKIPRHKRSILHLNSFLVTKFHEVFGKRNKANDTDPMNDFVIPIVPTFGNNDIMPHNIMEPGPSFWLKEYSHIWRDLVPEAQRHSFQRGGYFFTEVIKNKLAVFNLNTLYFFNHNGAVDGCAKKSEPGYHQMDWLRVQLQLMRERGLKAIMMGHVPPARTYNKESWDETCWQKYALWMRQYRDVVIGGLFGHMNIDHFMLQDYDEVKKKTKKGRLKSKRALGEDLTTQSKTEYLADLREDWARIPDVPPAKEDSINRKKKHKSKREDYLQKIGGEWAERYSVSLVSASVVPNYFPALRVIEYNISGLDQDTYSPPPHPHSSEPAEDDQNELSADLTQEDDAAARKKKKHKKKKKRPNFIVPSPPSDTSPPGPAYSPQTFTWLGYKQFFANLTRINAAAEKSSSDVDFHYELEYDTTNDTVYGVDDLTVKSWVDLARRIGRYEPKDSSSLEEEDDILSTVEDGLEDEERKEVRIEEGDVSSQKHKKHKKHKKKKKKKKKQERKEREATERLWFTFLRRAYVGTKGEEELREEYDGV